MKLSRRAFSRYLATAATAPLLRPFADSQARNTPWHESIAEHARTMAHTGDLRLLIPEGSAANISAATREFTRLSGVGCVISEVPVDEINVELILRANTEDATIDVALPATFGLPDLIKANAIVPLDEFATRYEPDDFSDGYLYRVGDHYNGKLYGYQTDGDVYMLFYNKRMLEDAREQQAYEQLTGRTLQPANSWEELDHMMAFFHRPDDQQYGGCLFRNAGYLVWEWWARFHAKGYLPLSDKALPNINNAAGVAVLEEMIAATEFQSPASRTNGLFDNWKDFANDNVFCNIGWGGTQKYLMGQPSMRDNLVHTALPGIRGGDESERMGYFNWGWNYTVSSQSTRKELGYLLALFCTSPAVSTLAVREPEGYFDPFRQRHYEDTDIEKVYGRSFLNAHKDSMRNSIPDFYLSGQSNYLDTMRQQILAAMAGSVTSQQALDACAQQWTHITRRLGTRQQRERWSQLQDSYPEKIRALLKAE